MTDATAVVLLLTAHQMPRGLDGFLEPYERMFNPNHKKSKPSV